MDIFIKTIEEMLQKNATKLYIFLASAVLVIFCIWFSNTGLLPLNSTGDFALLIAFVLILSIYRTGWAFLFLVATLTVENVNIAPAALPLSLRPYQLLAICIALALVVKNLKKKTIDLPNFFWVDFLVILFSFAGFFSASISAQRAVSFKQSAVELSFVLLYFLARIYVQSRSDVSRIAPFFFLGGFVTMLYGIWQNVRFAKGVMHYEVMAGRPNATFTEPDWLGVFLVFYIGTVYALLHHVSSLPLFEGKRGGNIIRCGLYALLSLTVIVLVITVSRSAWVGVAAVTLGYFFLTLLSDGMKIHSRQIGKAGGVVLQTGIAIGLALAIVYGLRLTTFQLANRAKSTGSGLQKITIACRSDVEQVVPLHIASVDDLKDYGCRHIDLEDIGQEKEAGNRIEEVYRPDPNIGLRAHIYQISLSEIKKHPIFGIGWGSINSILGKDERGAGLNASNIFLEVWLGSGLLGVGCFVVVLGYILCKALGAFFEKKKQLQAFPLFILLGLAAIVVPNLFNSGIFLAYVWVFLAISVSLLHENQKV